MGFGVSGSGCGRRGVVQRFVRREKVGFAEGEKIRTVEREERETAMQLGEFVEVECEEEDAIHEPMRLRDEAVVQHGALVKAGIQR